MAAIHYLVRDQCHQPRKHLMVGEMSARLQIDR